MDGRDKPGHDGGWRYPFKFAIAMPSRASSSARSSRVPGVAFDPVPFDVVRFSAASSRCHSSTFLTGFLSAVLQPFFFQPWIQS